MAGQRQVTVLAAAAAAAAESPDAAAEAAAESHASRCLLDKMPAAHEESSRCKSARLRSRAHIKP